MTGNAKWFIPVCCLCGASFSLPCSAWAADAPTELYSCSFARGAWQQDDWVFLKRPDWDRLGSWVQKDGCIENETPVDATEEEMLGKRAAETFTSMVHKEKVKGDSVITSRMWFAHRMAPSIVLAVKSGEDAKGEKMYVEHFEIVLFDQGINVWHHVHEDGKSTWSKVAFCRFEVEREKVYELRVEKRGKVLSVSAGGITLGYRDDSLPDEYHAGITGSEGVNRFYDFAVQRPD